jgi:hypothetical protein
VGDILDLLKRRAFALLRVAVATLAGCSLREPGASCGRSGVPPFSGPSSSAPLLTVVTYPMDRPQGVSRVGHMVASARFWVRQDVSRSGKSLMPFDTTADTTQGATRSNRAQPSARKSP